MSLNNSTITITINSGETSTVGLTSDSHPVSYTFPAVALTSGTGANAAQKVATQSITVDTTGTTIDLTAMTGGPGNAAVNFTKIKWLYVENTDATNTLVIGNAASNQWTGIISSTTATITIRPGGCAVFVGQDATGMAVSGGSKSVLFKAGASTVAIKIIAVGEGS
jgi:hypothetical protein